MAQRIVLDNIKQSLNVSWKGLVNEARSHAAPTLARFLEESGVEVEDLYRGTGRSWLDLKRAAGWDTTEPGQDDKTLAGAFGRMLHLDDLERLRFIRAAAQLRYGALPEDDRIRRMAAMLHFSLYGARTPFSRCRGDLVTTAGQPVSD